MPSDYSSRWGSPVADLDWHAVDWMGRAVVDHIHENRSPVVGQVDHLFAEVVKAVVAGGDCTPDGSPVHAEGTAADVAVGRASDSAVVGTNHALARGIAVVAGSVVLADEYLVPEMDIVEIGFVARVGYFEAFAGQEGLHCADDGMDFGPGIVAWVLVPWHPMLLFPLGAFGSLYPSCEPALAHRMKYSYFHIQSGSSAHWTSPCSQLFHHHGSV